MSNEWKVMSDEWRKLSDEWLKKKKKPNSLRGCLVCVFKQSFLIFKQHFTHFNTLFHPHVFSQIFLNNNFQFLNTHTKRASLWFFFFSCLKLRFICSISLVEEVLWWRMRNEQQSCFSINLLPRKDDHTILFRWIFFFSIARYIFLSIIADVIVLVV